MAIEESKLYRPHRLSSLSGDFWFARFRRDEIGAISAIYIIPNLNEALINVNGLRYPWNYLELFVQMKKQPECVSVKRVLVLPETIQ